jgi:hypothetical protein
MDFTDWNAFYLRDNKRSVSCFFGNKGITSANGANYTSLGHRTRIRAGQKSKG